MPPFTLREAVPSDAPHILSLIKALALYERNPTGVLATEDLVRENCFGKVANAVLAEVEGQDEPVGMALYFLNFSTCEASPSSQGG